VHALGVASFGPLDVDHESSTYGHITTTPKPGWQQADLLSPFRVLRVPLGFNTDVQAAALGELTHGQHGYGSDTCKRTAHR